MTRLLFYRTFLFIILNVHLVKESRCVFTPAALEILGLDKLNKDEDTFSKEYDFIVIGGGSAGSVLANRLTENPDWTVLVLERGIEESIVTDVPLLAPALYATNYVIMDRSEPRPQNIKNPNGSYCLAMKDARCTIVSGNAVGGTSVVNFMVYARGSPGDYDDWEAFGNPGWSYKHVLPYFIKSENCKLPDADFRYHGQDGFLNISYSSFDSPITESFLQAAMDLGYEIIDYNGRKSIGFSYLQATLRNGRRNSASKAFLRPIRDRPNFYLSQESTVTKIVINQHTKTAVGVWFLKNNKQYFVKARKEVLLSAGSLISPKLLMLSGIGPRDHLKSLGIRVIENLPVGYNLMDHVCFPVLNFLVNQSLTIVESRLVANVSSVLDYLINGSGPYTLPGGTDGIGFLSMNEDSRQNGIADVELILGLSAIIGDELGAFKNIAGISDDFVDTVFGKYIGLDAFTIVPILLKPKSRGRVTLRSNDPLDTPIYELNYYDDADDVKTMILGLRKAIEIASSKAFERYNTTLVPLIFPGCQDTVYMSDSYWECVVRHITASLGHYSGTCKMSPRNKSGVVDHRLRVHGIKSLRVVDNSIMPSIIAGHTVATAYMIGEKASDMIKEDWNRRSS